MALYFNIFTKSLKTTIEINNRTRTALDLILANSSCNMRF